MYTMKEVCDQVGISYEALRFYCNEGLVPNVKRRKNNYRAFDERDVRWLKGLQCLRKCGMSIKDMKGYMNLCLKGASTIPERKCLLAVQKEYLLGKIDEVNQSIAYIDGKQIYYDDVLSGETPYSSSLLAIGDDDF
jgi:Predicted transcriptional regulators